MRHTNTIFHQNIRAVPRHLLDQVAVCEADNKVLTFITNDLKRSGCQSASNFDQKLRFRPWASIICALKAS